MTCPNCGLANPDTAKFCANCGTPFAAAPPQQPYNAYPNQPQYQPAPPAGGNSMGKNIAIGCLIAVLIVILFGLSCTRACFRRHRYYRYGAAAILTTTAPSLALPRPL
ncbi:MAG: zinc-ribbon domain-containing protein [Acidobacteriaceae bacterium]|nr:zinc-ribbon domain-containing protein [Acidobacteriaceae bacterium]